MKKLIVTFLILLIYNVSLAQSGWGYVNYTSYKTHAGNGNTNQYASFPYTAAEFDNILNTSNSNTTITHTGEVTLATMCDGSTGTPHWASDYYAIKFEFWFVPKETGTYRFGVNSDDASDFSVNGTIITTYYGGHGASGYQYGSINLVAGTYYKIVARYQEYGGGDALYVRWSKPSAPNTYSYWTNEVTNVVVNTNISANFTINTGNGIDPTKLLGKMYYFANNAWTQTSSNSAIALSSLGALTVNDFDTAKTNLGLFLTTSYTTSELTALYGNIVTLADVYLAFKEYSDRGILGNESGNTLTSGVQYMNADVDNTGTINEIDCYKLLQHVTGVKALPDSYILNNMIKLVDKTVYDSVTKLNWNTIPSYMNTTRSTYAPIIPVKGKSNYSFNINTTWKGDVNLSHSPSVTSAQASMNVRSFSTSVSNEIQASIVTELINDTAYATIKLDPASQEVVGTQFKLNYDNTVLKFNKVEHKTKGNPTNFGVDKGNYINLGSLITDGSNTLDNTTEYRISFLPIAKLNNILGLISIYITDAVNRAGTQLKIKII
jgi:hypothetical protein